MSARYAVYLAPPSDSALWRFGSRVLGRDAATGETPSGYAPRGLSVERWREMTATPRVYGFHATLKAPFRLREGRSLVELEAAAQRLARSFPAFDVGLLQVSSLNFGGAHFIALTPQRPPSELRALETRVVRELDDFRAPPTEAELSRRRPESLTERQRLNLADWGYPHVLDEFRLHFTLSGATDRAEELAPALAEDFETLDTQEVRADALVLFAQAQGGDFRILRRFALANPA